MSNNFGTLTRKQKYNIKSIINEDTMDIEYLFRNSRNQLERLSVIDAERQIALDNLRKLTQELKNQHLCYSSNKKTAFFTK